MTSQTIWPDIKIWWHHFFVINVRISLKLCRVFYFVAAIICTNLLSFPGGSLPDITTTFFDFFGVKITVIVEKCQNLSEIDRKMSENVGSYQKIQKSKNIFYIELKWKNTTVISPPDFTTTFFQLLQRWKKYWLWRILSEIVRKCRKFKSLKCHGEVWGVPHRLDCYLQK